MNQMTSVAEHEAAFRRGTLTLQTPLRTLKFIGAHIDAQLAAKNVRTVGDLARRVANRSKPQNYALLSEVSRNARANRCVVDPRGAARNGVSNQYHVRDINYNAYTTLRNLLLAVRRHWAVYARRMPLNSIPDAHVARDTATAVCSCVQTRAQCAQLERARECQWAQNRCMPRQRSRPQAFAGVDAYAGQHQSQGAPPPQARFVNRWRVPDNR